MGYEFFLSGQKTKVIRNYEVVGGSFQCMHCHWITDEARYYAAQKVLTWDCINCEQDNLLEGFSLD